MNRKKGCELIIYLSLELNLITNVEFTSKFSNLVKPSIKNYSFDISVIINTPAARFYIIH